MRALIVLIPVCLALGGAAVGGPVLDDILNTMFVDQSLVPSGDDYATVTPDKPLGQTFVTGDKTVRICRIALKVAYEHESWQPGESLVVTLWDSPKKQQKLGSFAIPYERRRWNGHILMFSVEADVQPSHQYYFEITVEGGDGTIHGILLARHDRPYESGEAYIGGQASDRDIWFETYVKKPVDRDAQFEEFFSNFDLDLPALAKVKAAVAAKDWDTACREFLNHMESRRDIFPEEDATPGLRVPPGFDKREADLVVQQKWPAQDGTIVDLGPDWNYHATWPTLGGVGLTRTGLMKPLAWAYSATGDPKYARAWNDMLISLFRNYPSPLKSGVIKGEGKIRPTVPPGISGSMWDSISIAARLHHETFYNRFRKSPLFTQDVRIAWWANMADMANCLERMEAGGNWTTQNTSSLFSLGMKYPEFKKSKQWFAMGFEGIKQNLLDNTFPDGALREATTGYHSFSLGMFFDTITRAKQMGLEVSEDHMKRLEAMFNYSMYSTQPDWTLPVWGDTNRPIDQTAQILRGGEYFNRPDMIWVGTKGKRGTKPAHDSIAFSEAGYFIMRSGWDPSARYLVTRNGFSQSHYHHDQLSVIVQAYGSDLLPDMGVYTYGTPECNELVKTTSHSTISVDGADILPGVGENKWSTLPGFDYFDGTSPGYKDIPGVRHRRRIVFVKPDYWVVADDVTGDGEHSAVQYWHFAPGALDVDQKSGVVRTTNKTGGNIAIIPLSLSSAVPVNIGEGLYAVNWEKCTKAPVAKYEKRGLLPHSFLTVLYPYPAEKPFDAKARQLAAGTNRSRVAEITTPRSVDYVAFGEGNARISVSGVGFDLVGEAGFVRTDAKTRKVTAFAWHEGRSISFGRLVLASSPVTLRSLSARIEGDTIRIYTDGSPRGLKIAVLGARNVIVNGKRTRVPAGAKTITLSE
ncbi:MAG: alginate lyase family protein [Armatimonadota bacterium]|nr:alginate lyase family protein [Armatimonadota bacterium]